MEDKGRVILIDLGLNPRCLFLEGPRILMIFERLRNWPRHEILSISEKLPRTSPGRLDWLLQDTFMLAFSLFFLSELLLTVHNSLFHL